MYLGSKRNELPKIVVFSLGTVTKYSGRRVCLLFLMFRRKASLQIVAARLSSFYLKKHSAQSGYVFL